MMTVSLSPCPLVSLSQNSARPWFISRAGFTPGAEEFARREGIMISSQAEIKQLGDVIRHA